jgi:hypothetical protein
VNAFDGLQSIAMDLLMTAANGLFNIHQGKQTLNGPSGV